MSNDPLTPETQLRFIAGDNIRRLRLFYRIKLSELSEAIGHSTSSLSLMERGLNVINVDGLQLVGLALGVSPELLIRYEGYLEITNGREQCSPHQTFTLNQPYLGD